MVVDDLEREGKSSSNFCGRQYTEIEDKNHIKFWENRKICILVDQGIILTIFCRRLEGMAPYTTFISIKNFHHNQS